MQPLIEIQTGIKEECGKLFERGLEGGQRFPRIFTTVPASG